MQKGDIGNEVVPRFVCVFEGLIGYLPDIKAQRKHDRALKFHNYSRAMQCYVMNELMARHIWDIVMRYDYKVGVVTYLSPDMVDPMNLWLENAGLPIAGSVVYSDPVRFARELAFRPDIARVFDANPQHIFMYGSKGTIMNPGAPNFFYGT